MRSQQKFARADSPVEEIKERLQVEDVVGEYIQLKKAGTNYKALCPFHSEKTPSFMVSPEKGIWHCFGCGEGGDIFTFVMKMEGADFPEALRALARKANVVLRRVDKKAMDRKGKLYEALEAAADYFHQGLLRSRTGKMVQKYLAERGIGREEILEFRIGYAPRSSQLLSQYLRKQGFSDEQIVEAGLSVRRETAKKAQEFLRKQPRGGAAGAGAGAGERNFYDRFRHRVIFPIADPSGRIVAFGGRMLEDILPTPGNKRPLDEIAKYLNSPQTVVYNKSRVLYGLDRARVEVRKKNYAILVEGYTDVIASSRAGAVNVVATSGTALTVEQIRLLRKYSKNVILAFDMDIAGDIATRRSIDLFLQEGMNVRVARIPEGKDPADVVREDTKVWLRAIKNSQRIMDFYFERLLTGVNLGDITEKKNAARALIEVIAKLPDQIERAHYVEQLAEKIDIEEKVLSEVLVDIRRGMESARREVNWSYVERIPKKGKELNIENRAYLEREQLILGLLFRFPVLFKKAVSGLRTAYFSQKVPKAVYKEAISLYNKEHKFDISAFEKGIAKRKPELSGRLPVFGLAVDQQMGGATEEEAEEVFRDLALRMRQDYLKRELRALQRIIKEAEASGDKGEIDKLSKKFEDLTDELAGLSGLERE